MRALTTTKASPVKTCAVAEKGRLLVTTPMPPKQRRTSSMTSSQATACSGTEHMLRIPSGRVFNAAIPKPNPADNLP